MAGWCASRVNRGADRASPSSSTRCRAGKRRPRRPGNVPMAPECILIIEDDATLLRVLKDNFEFAGYRVVVATDGRSGLLSALDERPDLIVLDVMLPEINGYELCRLLRKEKLDVPVIMLTAKGQESDVVLGLELGADDYVTKPFSMKELLARAAAFLRRRRSAEASSYRFGEFE